MATATGQKNLIDIATGIPPRNAATIAAPSAPTAYSAHVSGGTTVTSNAATDLDTTAAALETLRDEVAALTTTVTSILTLLQNCGLRN